MNMARKRLADKANIWENMELWEIIVIRYVDLLLLTNESDKQPRTQGQLDPARAGYIPFGASMILYLLFSDGPFLSSL
jgi:hypothetical protein